MESGEEILHEVAYQGITNELKRFPTLRALYESDVYRANQDALFWLLGVAHPYLSESVHPRIQDFVRVVQWNIEKGKQFEGVVEMLSLHPILRQADLIFINEADYGMARSNNRHVARELGQWLRMHVAFAPAHLELTKGTGDDLNAPGENAVALQGNAVLSRYPMDQLRIVELPTRFNPFEFEEKRFGRRIALVADVFINHQKLTVVSTHLEVRATPRDRAKQMNVLMDKLNRLNVSGPVLLAGDFNTAVFSRGTRWRTLQGMAKLYMSRPPSMRERLLHPDRRRREPLFAVLKRYGFSTEEFNDHDATHVALLDGVEENNHVPLLLERAVYNKASQYGNQLEFKLDWIAGRSVKALSAGQVTDAKSGIVSISPQAVRGLRYQDRKLSDHDPVVVDIALNAD